MSNAKKTHIFIHVIALIGFCIILLGLVLCVKNAKFNKNGVKISATISEITTDYDSDGEINHDVYVDYEYNGEVYEHKYIGYYSSTMREGGKLKVIINPKKPWQVEAEGSVKYSWLIVLLLGGVTFGFFGFYSFRIIKKRIKSLFYIRKGKKLVATITDVSFNEKKRISGLFSCEITCVADADGMSHVFKCVELTSINKIDVGSLVDVYVLDEDYEKYFIDFKEN